ncbi:Nicastrin [Nymphon striatum]|nr:Nicastrin [Nymphon striatum]
MKLTTFIISLNAVMICTVLGDRIGDKIYRSIENENACFRRMNATHQIGCSSEREGNVGILYILEENSDIDTLLKDGPNAPYIPLIKNPLLFSRENVIKLKNSGKINGLLVAASVNDTDFPNGFSPDKSCPNENFGLYTDSENSKYSHCKQGSWLKESNPALGMMFEDWEFPISYISDGNDIQAIQECFDKHNVPITKKNHDSPMCALELSSRMMGAVNTPTCMRRSTLVTNMSPSAVCDPLGDMSLFSLLCPIAVSDLEDRSVIIVAARLDSFSMFYSESSGADSAVSGVATLLAVSNALSKVKQEFMELTKNQTNIVFALFNGEAFDYIGSSRLVYDMIKHGAPMKLSKISHVIEVNQLFSPKGDLWIHTDPVTRPHKSEEINNLVDILKKEGELLGLKIVTSDKARALPPSSVQSFLSKDENITAMVLSNFDDKFVDKFYNGMYDNIDEYHIDGSDNKLVQKLAAVSTAIARTIFKLATNESKASIKVEDELIHGILECYMQNASCELNRKAISLSLVDQLSTLVYPSYVGVSSVTNGLTVATSYLLQYLTGSFKNVSKDQCISNGDVLVNWISGPDLNNTGVCWQSLVFNHTAVSPAFAEKDWSSTEYSTWTESRWNNFSIRLFLKASFIHELTALLIGLALTVLSFIFIYFVNKQSDVLFTAATIDMPPRGVAC